ncbi:hypothetical protein BB559_004268 [Furculomyces boomerangus]|uniref:Mitochondrial Rho GTPase n=2 Tax=Harpellales TaxID=61421 RepID=A0A2T9YFQ9_9FUNG|nr:hypothetical protein BB559_004268 [Furculomyces boomerangus]PWA01477.1 hypothetical protein BB558_002428 [Smittium angustum]
MRTEMRILLVGEDGSGKSSLITTFIKEEFLLNVQKIVPEVTIPPEVTPENVTTHIIDTSASADYRDRLEAELTKANVICMVYSVIDRESFNRIHQVPIILVGNKIDRRQTLPLESVVQPTEVLHLMNDYREIETCLESSSKELINVTELFYFAQKAVLHPTRPLFDAVEHTLKPKCSQALGRVFWLCDMDGDGILNYTELNEFQKTCFNTSLNQKELDDIIDVVHHSFPEGVVKNGLNLQEIDINCSVELSAGGFEFITELFRRFDLDKDAALNNSELKNLFSVIPYEKPWKEYNFPDCTVTNQSGNVTLQGWLAMWAMVTLLNHKTTLEYFAYLGYPGNTLNGIKIAKRLVKGTRIKRKFVESTNRTQENKYKKITSYYPNKEISGQHDSSGISGPNSVSDEFVSNRENIGTSGIPNIGDSNNISGSGNNSGISVNFNKNAGNKGTSGGKQTKSGKKVGSNGRSSSLGIFSGKQGARTASLVYVVGSPGCGKTSLIRSFVKKNFNEKYNPTQSSMSYVNSVEIKAEQHFLVIREFGLYTNMALGNNRVVDSCDLLCMVYDSSDPNSFNYLVELRNHYNLDHVPTMFIATKCDLDFVEQRTELPPDVYCNSLKLATPINISVKKDQLANIFEKMAVFASKPATVTPSLLLLKRNPLNVATIFKYSAILTVTIAIAWGTIFGNYDKSKWIERYIYRPFRFFKRN